MGFWNTREYVLFRDSHRCQCCHGKSKDPVLNVHHIESRKTGGDSPDNLITLYVTKHTRITNKLEKSYTVDARCISGHPLAIPAQFCLMLRQTRRHNRQIHKANILKGGRRKNNQAPYIVKGFRLFNKVLFNGQECFIFGRRSSGSFDIRRFDGTKVYAGIGYKKLKFLAISRRYLLTQ